MSGSLNSFRANLTFGNLSPRQFDALYEEVLKEKAKRLIGEEALNCGISWREVSLTADLRLSSGHCHIVEQTLDLTRKDIPGWDSAPLNYNPHVKRGFDYTSSTTGIECLPCAPPASGEAFRGWHWDE